MAEEIGRYRIIRRLGRGGMGTVHLAEDPSGRRVALKVINAGLADEPEFRERFRQEVETARRVRRFSTAAVIDADLDGDPAWVATEYIDGPDLAAAVAKDGPLRGSDLDALAVGTVTALGSLHEVGLVHRDLKPGNVLLSQVGPRLIDFGIARALEHTHRLTSTGQVVGTPGYVAPELLRGEPLSPASDLFSWGCLIAFAGTGRAPFDGANVGQIMYRVMHEEPDLDGLEDELAELVARVLDRDPQRRPTAAQIRDALTGLPANGDRPTREDAAHGRADLPYGTRRLDPPTRLGPPEGLDGPESPAGRRNWRWAVRGRKRIGLAAGTAVVVAAAAATLVAVELKDDGPTGPKPPVVTNVEPAYQDTLNGGQDVDGYHPDLSKGQSPATDDFNIPYSVTMPSTFYQQLGVKIGSTDAKATRAGMTCTQSIGGVSFLFLLRADGTAEIVTESSDAANLRLTRKVKYHKNAFNLLQATCSEAGTQAVARFWVNGDYVGEWTERWNSGKWSYSQYCYEWTAGATTTFAFRDLAIWPVQPSAS